MCGTEPAWMSDGAGTVWARVARSRRANLRNRAGKHGRRWQAGAGGRRRWQAQVGAGGGRQAAQVWAGVARSRRTNLRNRAGNGRRAQAGAQAVAGRLGRERPGPAAPICGSVPVPHPRYAAPFRPLTPSPSLFLSRFHNNGNPTYFFYN